MRDEKGRFVENHTPWNKGKVKVTLDSERIHRLYWIYGLSQRKIGEQHGVSRSTIARFMKKHGIPLRSLSESLKLSHPFRGKHHSQETRQKISAKMKKLCKNPRFRETLGPKNPNPWLKGKTLEEAVGKQRARHIKKKMSEANRGKHSSPNTEFKKGNVPWWIKEGRENPARTSRKKKSAITRRLWKESEYVKKQMEARNVQPNKTEIRLQKLMQRRNLPFKYVGDGTIIIDGKCPDFINKNGRKQIIELFGDYWHDPEEVDTRKRIFAKYGFKTLIIWESELNKDPNEVLTKIEEFAFGN